MTVKVIDVTPFIINIRDLEQTKFKQARKRVLISAFDFSMTMKTAVAKAQDQLEEKQARPKLLSA